MRLKAGGKRQRLRVQQFRCSPIVMREVSEVGSYRKYFSMNILKNSPASYQTSRVHGHCYQL
jgi:hypothetical protein